MRRAGMRSAALSRLGHLCRRSPLSSSVRLRLQSVGPFICMERGALCFPAFRSASSTGSASNGFRLLPWPTKVGAPVTGKIGYDHGGPFG